MHQINKDKRERRKGHM